jgi:hypothetical protein
MFIFLFFVMICIDNEFIFVIKLKINNKYKQMEFVLQELF